MASRALHLVFGLSLAMLLLACEPSAEPASGNANGQGDARAAAPGAAAAAAAPAAAPDAPTVVPAEEGGEVLSRAGLYRVTLRPEAGRIPRGQLHAWVVDVAMAEGQPFRPTRLAFNGAMPQHQHGFLTVPRVTRALGEARFLVEGVKFHMGGRWTLEVELVGPDGPDVAVLDVQVAP